MKMMNEILSKMGITEEPLSVRAFAHEEGEGEYDVWRVQLSSRCLVLKRAKRCEASLYGNYLKNVSFAPKLVAQAHVDGDDYLLMEHIEGHDLMRCSRSDLTAVINSMAQMQRVYWDFPQASDALESRRNRRAYLHSELLERAYDAYLQNCEQIPHTLCHDDLLPFNVIVSDGRAVFIDWEVGGILPYPASLARLLAHTSEEEAALFYMTETDRQYAIDSYYTNFLSSRGVSYESYRRSLDRHLFYEYCEWVYVGNKFGDTTGDLFRKYRILATNMAKKLGF